MNRKVALIVALVFVLALGAEAVLLTKLEADNTDLVMNHANGHFLLNRFWTVELTNSSPILIEDGVFAAARAANTIRFPAQTTEIALYAQRAMNVGWEDFRPQIVSGVDTVSGSGFQYVHEWLSARSLLPTEPSGGDGCGL